MAEHSLSTTASLPSYLKGLNTLRFFAAFFVIFGHGHRSLVLLNILPKSDLPVFDRAGTAVELFFTLSGFLITYLLLIELKKTGTIHIGFFYFRRVIRIWPLYFLCLIAGLIVLEVLVPRLTHTAGYRIPIWPFIFFAPNYAATHYKVGLLYPLWSLGIEEQFYLLWAPLLFVFRRHITAVVAIGATLTASGYCYANYRLQGRIDSRTFDFLMTLKFHNMLIGALFACIVVYHRQSYQRSILAKPSVQMLLIAIVLYHYFIGIYPHSTGNLGPVLTTLFGDVPMGIVLSFVYGCVFVNLSAIETPITTLEYQPFKYLGEISFGLYIFHMFVDYALRLGMQHVHTNLNPIAVSVIYLCCLTAITIAVAAISHRYYEMFFLNLRKKFKTVN